MASPPIDNDPERVDKENASFWKSAFSFLERNSKPEQLINTKLLDEGTISQGDWLDFHPNVKAAVDATKEMLGIAPSQRVVQRLEKYKSPLLRPQGAFEVADEAAGMAADVLQTGLAASDIAGTVPAISARAAKSLANEAGEVGKDITQKVVKTADKKAESAVTGKAFKESASEAPLPKYAGSVNLERQLISDEAKKFEVKMFEDHGLKVKVSHDELVDKAQEVVKRFRDEPDYFRSRLEAYSKGESPTNEEVLAHRMINAQNFQNFVDMAKQAEKGNVPKEVLEEMQKGIQAHYLSVTQPQASEAGRRLNSFNIEVGRSRAFDAISKLDKALNERQIADLNRVDFNDPKSVNDFVKRLPDPKFKEYFYEYWYNSILSGIPTHVVNAGSNTLWGAYQVPHRAHVGLIDNVISGLTGRPRQVYMDETLPLMAGNIKAIPKAAKSAWDVARHNRLTEIDDKWAKEMDFASGAFERSPSKIMRGIGKVITVPTRSLRAMDVAANAMAYDGQMAALARRTYNNMPNNTKIERDVFEKKFISNPPKWAVDEARKYAKYTTFTDDPGEISKWIQSGRDKIPGVRLIVPFVNTIGNIMKRGLEMTPGIGLAFSRSQPAAETIAKQIEGSIIALALFKKIQAGEITGAAPKDLREREAFYREGKSPWAIKNGDTYYQYRKVEPFNMLLSIATIAYDRIKRAKDEDTATDIFFNVANDIKDHIMDSGYFDGIAKIIDSKPGQIKSMPQQIASSLVPFSGFWRSVNRAWEAHEEGAAKVYDNKEWLSSFAQVIPGLYKFREPKLNVWGEEIELQGGVFRQWLPYKWSKGTTDDVEMFLEKLSNNLEAKKVQGVYPGIPQQWVKHHGEKIRLDDDIYRQYIVDYGKNAKDKLRERITGETNWKERLEENPESLKDRIESLLDKEREKARKRAIRRQLGIQEDTE
jgi:hypothetical protein